MPESGGQTGERGQDMILTFVQDISPKDRPLPEGRTYRVVLTLHRGPGWIKN